VRRKREIEKIEMVSKVKDDDDSDEERHTYMHNSMKR
jgi:hypothetical protein